MLDACDAPVIAALEVAKQNQGKLFILHVLEPSYFHECGPLESVRHFKTGEEIATSSEYRELVKSEIDKKCAGALKPYGSYDIQISYGKPSIEIRRWARKLGADLIVLGPHAGKIEDEKALIGIPIGNTVEDVIMHVTIPVMIIGRLLPPDKLHFKKIMVCIDFSRSCKNALEYSIKLAKRSGIKLFLFHMVDRRGSEKEKGLTEMKLREFCTVPKEIEHEYTVWEGSEPHLEILKYAREKDVDLIVTGSRTRESEDRPYIGSAVEQVSAQSFCPVIVVTHSEAVSKLK
jgi:nucleotide-binding universal stress UspA family protein